ncbi:MAG: DNA repair protein RecO [bacterium]|nr:DNA repair protein RecO [bacterium]
MFQNDYGIVLYNKRWSESSHILTLFCQRFGKLTFLSKGSRRPKSMIASYHKVASMVYCIWNHQPSYDLQHLLSIEFQDTPMQLDGFEHRWEVLRILQMVRQTLPVQVSYTNGYFQLLRTLFAMAQDPIKSNLYCIQFFIRWMAELGFGLTVERCKVCGYQITGTKIFADIQCGHFICEKCLAKSSIQVKEIYGLYLKGDTISSIRVLESIPETKVKSMKLSFTCLQELNSFINLYLHYHTGTTVPKPFYSVIH